MALSMKLYFHTLSGCEKDGVHLPGTSYFVCGTSASSCLVVQRTSKHLGHNSSAHFSGQGILSVLVQRTSRVKSWTGKREDSLAHWTSASHLSAEIKDGGRRRRRGRDREETQTQRQRQRQTGRQGQTDKQRQTDRHRQAKTGRGREANRQADRDRDRAHIAERIWTFIFE